MWLSPSLLLMMFSIVTSIILTISSPSLFIAWVGLELNTLAFIPLLLIKKIKLTSESSVKYFLTQTLASIIIILGGLLILIFKEEMSILFIMFGLAIKLGAAPFHSWIISVAESLPWVSLFFLLTIQKINPLLMVWNFSQSNSLVYFLISICSLITGALMGLTQTSIRALITFSSINHVGWLLISLYHDLLLGMLYFFIYTIILAVPICMFHLSSISHINQLPLTNLKASSNLIIFFSLLSLGGLPPFLGFLPKWAVLQSCMLSGSFVMSILMVVLSLFTLFYYLRLMFSAFIFGGMKLWSLSFFSFPWMFNILFSLSVGGLFLAYFI
uniref:NADH-ubiquinone oxidoreductase chain 2 n=1 Tax=Daphnia laevis TaxID=42853 RepID=A0A5Q0RYX5_9CRUS|nr:NADH dehydrogenase subunit 2 [Daphnia laevis]QGA47442.1 NADH dehydrogenase subunit 2 [Daphnia laevis]